MNNKVEITNTEPQTEQLAEQLFGLLAEQSQTHIKADIEPFAIKIQADNGWAAATGKSYWGAMAIDFAWVSEEVRGQGLGSKLFDAIEAEARRRGCISVILDTMSFQARGFYLKRGYAHNGNADGYFEGIKRHYFQKTL